MPSATPRVGRRDLRRSVGFPLAGGARAVRAGVAAVALLAGVAGCDGPTGAPDAGGDASLRDLGGVDAQLLELGLDLAVVEDFGVLPDLGLPPDQDSDGDGLCDTREITRGTRLDRADSDGDQVTDYYEFVLGTNPLDPSTPTTAELLFLSESPGVATATAIRRRFTGAGEDFTGAFVALPVSDPEALTARTFYVQSFATSANPMGNVALVDAELERYYGVLGSTELGFEVELAVPSGFLPRGCGRIYPLRYEIKRSDGAYVGGERRFLVVLPVGGSFATGPWCAPARCI